MVSKVAVIALVAIVACPILLGYAMNLNEVTITEYKANDDSVNVTPLLLSGAAYTAANADLYQLNSNFTWLSDLKTYPTFEQISTVKSSMPIDQGHFEEYTGGDFPHALENRYLYYFSLDYTYSATSYVRVGIYENANTITATYDHVINLYYDDASSKLYTTCLNSPTSTTTHIDENQNFTGFKFELVNLSSIPMTYGLSNKSGVIKYADFSAGYYFKKPYIFENIKIIMPERTQSVLMTLNLDSITDSNYTLSINDNLRLKKTTTDGVVSWTAYQVDYYSNVIWSQDLYYGAGISDNTYQIKMICPDEKIDSTDPIRPSPTWYQYHRYVEFRYVGSWPSLIGEANYYQKYDYDYWWYSQPDDSYFDSIYLDPSVNKRTPTIRVDAAQFQAFQYQVIEDNTYQPSSFKENPATTISNVQRTGTQLIFGGNTYTISKGNINLGSHSISVDGLIFSSAPNEYGTYDNKIGNTIVSTTATPSSIQFVGKWSASVSTASMSANTYTKTEWTPGQFAWNGLDQNFLMVGLLTSLGAFIALGIYIRRSKANLWPLLLVCGGAAMLFFCML